MTQLLQFINRLFQRQDQQKIRAMLSNLNT